MYFCWDVVRMNYSMMFIWLFNIKFEYRKLVKDFFSVKGLRHPKVF